jgi:dihydrofolate reductase
MKPRVSIIAAIGRNRELGKSGDLIWRIPADLKHVKDLTMSHPLIMGRKTYESIGRPLPGRTMIVVTRSAMEIEGCIVKNSLEDAVAEASSLDTDEIFIFGGAQLYEQALATTDRLYLTRIDTEDSEADTFFPPYKDTFIKVIESETHTENGLTYEWIILERN